MPRRRSRRLSPLTKSRSPSYLFPESGDYVVYSKPLFHIRVGEDAEELVELEAEMLLHLSDVVDTKTGREVRIKVNKWDAVGPSRLLGGDVSFELERSLRSYVKAGSRAADLPGRMVISGWFSTYLDANKIDEHRGRAVGLISTFPPASGDLFDISGAEVRLGDVTVVGMTCICAR